MKDCIEKVWIKIDDNQKRMLNVPCKFDYDKFWIGHHPCIQCQTEVTFSESNIIKEPMYWTKIFDINFLRGVLNKIENAQLININGYEAIVMEDYDTIFPIPISPAHYQCDNCTQRYSIIYSFGCHDSNDKLKNPFDKLCTCGIQYIITPPLR